MKRRLDVAVLLIELLGFGFIAGQAGILIESGSPHWLGYIGSALVIAGAVVWGKLVKKVNSTPACLHGE